MTPEDAVRTLIGMVDDPSRSGVIETPGRVVKALLEMTQGYHADPKDILAKTFDEPCQEMILVSHIAFTSLCEHHLLPFTGSVDVGYLPGKVVGLSKIARLVDCFSQRLQIQERLTGQIADALMEHLDAKGAAVVVRGQHACMSCRGVKKSEAVMTTSAMRGLFKDNHTVRTEFLTLCMSS